MKIAICMYGIIPATRNMVQNHIRYITGPLQKFIRISLGKMVEFHYFLCSSSLNTTSMRMLDEYHKILSFEEIRFYPEHVSLLQKALLMWKDNNNLHSYHQILMIRTDMFFTHVLRQSDLNLMFCDTQDNEDVMYLGEDMGFMMGTPSILCQLESIHECVDTHKKQRPERLIREFLEKKKIRPQWISIVGVRILTDGLIHPSDKEKCPYLQDLLDNDLSSSPLVL